MFRKTTVYLSNQELVLLQKMSNLRNITVAEAIRMSIRDACKPKTKEEKSVWDTLDKIWAKTAEIDSGIIEGAVDSAVGEVRSARKARRRS